MSSNKMTDEMWAEFAKSLQEVPQEDGFKATPASALNHRERRNRKHYFMKELKKHKKRKPKVNLEELDEEKQQQAIFKMQGWATRYGILVRKIQEYGAKQTDKRG